VKQEIDGADSVRIGRDPFAVAGCLKVQDRRAGGEDPPVDCVDERLLLGKAETCPGWRKGACLLGSGTRGQGKCRPCDCCGETGIQVQRRTPSQIEWIDEARTRNFQASRYPRACTRAFRTGRKTSRLR
jgi:hypothetical protein